MAPTQYQHVGDFTTFDQKRAMSLLDGGSDASTYLRARAELEVGSSTGVWPSDCSDGHNPGSESSVTDHSFVGSRGRESGGVGGVLCGCFAVGGQSSGRCRFFFLVGSSGC